MKIDISADRMMAVTHNYEADLLSRFGITPEKFNNVCPQSPVSRTDLHNLGLLQSVLEIPYGTLGLFGGIADLLIYSADHINEQVRKLRINLSDL